MRRLRLFVYHLMNPEDENRVGKALDTFIVALIAFNVLMVILETEESLSGPYKAYFIGFEWFSSLFFTVEYLLRTWSCVEDPRYRGWYKGRLRYMITFMALVDITAILPFYLPMIIEMDLRFVRAVRLFRLFRLFKMGRYSTSIKFIGSVFVRRKEELVMTLFVVIIMLIMASSILYFVEHEAQPDAFGSIPEAMWWGVVTLTTVGYGDIYPITGLGRFLGAGIALVGVGMVALPAGLIASGFNEIIQERAGKLSKMTNCPRCGQDLRHFAIRGVYIHEGVEGRLREELEAMGIKTASQRASVELDLTALDGPAPDHHSGTTQGGTIDERKPGGTGESS
ncbi:MAG: ion transporter [Bradymonadales bacterium]|nr:ion transporter [Bradymonadales bacterium]